MCQQDLILLCQSQQLLVSPSLHANLPVASLKGKQCMCSLKLQLKLHGKKMTGAAVIFLTKFGHCGYETWELAQETHSAERWFVPQSSCTKGAFHRFSGAPCLGNCGCRFPRAPWCFAQSIFRELQADFWEGHWLWAGTTSKLTNHFLQSLTELRACCPLHSPETPLPPLYHHPLAWH